MTGYVFEVNAMKTLRHHFPAMRQRTLATRIKTQDFKFDETRALATQLAARSWASVYSALRRIDA